MNWLQNSRHINVLEGKEKAMYEVGMDLLGECAPRYRVRIECLKRSLPWPAARGDESGPEGSETASSPGGPSAEALPPVEIADVGWDSAAWFIRLISSNGGLLRTHPVER